VEEILVPEGGSRIASHIAIRIFEFEPSLHLIYRLPSLYPTENKRIIEPEVSFITMIMTPNNTKQLYQNIICSANVQHDCATSNCTLVDSVVRQERLNSSRSKLTCSHLSTNRFIVNPYSIHNYRHVLPLIPHHLRYSVPSESNPDNVRRQAATYIREKKLPAFSVSQSIELPVQNEISQISPDTPNRTFEPQTSGKKGKRKSKPKGRVVNSFNHGSIPLQSSSMASHLLLQPFSRPEHPPADLLFCNMSAENFTRSE
jgi:hypothetical protein